MGRKRQRTQKKSPDQTTLADNSVGAVDQVEEHQEPTDEELPHKNADKSERHSATADEDGNSAQAQAKSERLAKELEIWELFKDEYHETVEQLPLSLHRQFTLMRELDEQVIAYNTDLLSFIRKYVHLRLSLASRAPPQSGAQAENQTQDTANAIDVDLTSASAPPNPTDSVPISVESPSTPGPSATSLVRPSVVQPRSPSSARNLTQAASLSSVGTLPSRTHLKKHPETTRALLAQIAWLTEETVRGSQEKVNLAQSAYDTVDRHIRLLDLAIKEQETSLSLGLRPGTQPAPIVQTDASVSLSMSLQQPASTSSGGQAQSSTVEQETAPTLGLVGEGEGEAEEGAEGRRGGRRGRSGKKKGRSHRKKESSVALAPDPPQTQTQTQVKSVKLNLGQEPQPQAVTAKGAALGTALAPAPLGDIEVNPHEPRYCYCNQVSFGEMIACDNPNCEREWFHMQCAGLTQAPGRNEKWYCRDCEEERRKNRRKSGRK